MSKIMLVEDDKSLREIYSIRLVAEGYEVVSAGDGEEALALAVQERPDLVLSDVMMPKISGFDMLDILRSTPETKDIKVIMMTALSSEDQRQRGENLGADRYLVKSQVGIEDVVNAVHEVMGDGASAAEQTAPAQTAAEPAQAVQAVSVESEVASITSGVAPVMAEAPATPVQPTTPAAPAQQIASEASAAPMAPVSPETPAVPETPVAPAAPESPAAPSIAEQMEQLLNTPDTTNATPANPAQ